MAGVLIKFVTLGVLCIQYYAYKISFPATKKGQCALETVHGVRLFERCNVQGV